MKLKLNTVTRLPSLTALRTFEVAARYASFTEAADELHVTLGAVSRQIRFLENELGVALFDRTGNAVSLNAKGRELSKEVSRAFSLINTAVERIRPMPRRTLTLTCTLGIASHWLSSRLPALLAREDNLSLVVDAAEQVRNLNAGEADIAIRYSPQSAPPVHSRLLLDDAFLPLASPAYLSRLAPLKTPADIQALRLIHSPWKNRQGQGIAGWPDWFAAFGVRGASSPGAFTVNSTGYALQDAIDNGGVVLGSLAVCRDAMADGRLSPVFGDHYRLASAYEYRLVWNPEIQVSRAVCHWINLLLEAAGRQNEFDLSSPIAGE
ncbi:LysR substrate-binding domain-containing protein [Martelella alba]|uniref:LysR family transcriptional regulator n=1 Tax=Martelella alba TaxID=2590451 RepID=A0ABY2SNV8_9HYPH|nr:LysR substrate-binding domain-containing protein [Martelella alba]TKI07673.1 LysR family transcriptional regulator [Martelella alba]